MSTPFGGADEDFSIATWVRWAAHTVGWFTISEGYLVIFLYSELIYDCRRLHTPHTALSNQQPFAALNAALPRSG